MKDLRDKPIQGFGRLEPADIYPQGERSGLSAEKVGVLASGNIVAFRDFDGEVSQRKDNIIRLGNHPQRPAPPSRTTDP